MKYLLLLIFFASPSYAQEDISVSGKVEESAGCSPKAMVWLSLDKESYHERLLLMHTEVPSKGTFKFYVKPGKYQIRATDEAGCEYLERVVVKDKEVRLSVMRSKK
jgi:hypothetical protein